MPRFTAVSTRRDASVFLNDARGNREAQTGATLLCREKRIEEPLAHFRLTFQGPLSSTSMMTEISRAFGRRASFDSELLQLDRSTCAERVRGVLHEID